jgi:hypothetical protein
MLDMTEPYFAEARRLTAETGIKHEVDHIESLALGAPHHHDNLQVVTKRFNQIKQGRVAARYRARCARVPGRGEMNGLAQARVRASPSRGE